MEKYPSGKPLKSRFNQESLNLQTQIKLMQDIAGALYKGNPKLWDGLCPMPKPTAQLRACWARAAVTQDSLDLFAFPQQTLTPGTLNLSCSQLLELLERHQGQSSLKEQEAAQGENKTCRWEGEHKHVTKPGCKSPLELVLYQSLGLLWLRGLYFFPPHWEFRLQDRWLCFQVSYTSGNSEHTALCFLAAGAGRGLLPSRASTRALRDH